MQALESRQVAWWPTAVGGGYVAGGLIHAVRKMVCIAPRHTHSHPRWVRESGAPGHSVFANNFVLGKVLYPPNSLPIH
jgi:hypothetical protein